MKKIVVFNIELNHDDAHLCGICRWIGNSVQVELTQPYAWLDEIKFYKRDYHLTEDKVKETAIKLLIEIYEDLSTSESAYNWFSDGVEATKRRISDTMSYQEEIAEVIPQMLSEYQQGEICKQEYLRRLWVVSHAIANAYHSV